MNGYEEARLCETSLTGLLLRLEVVPLLGRDAVQLGVVHLLAHGACVALPLSQLHIASDCTTVGCGVVTW